MDLTPFQKTVRVWLRLMQIVCAGFATAAMAFTFITDFSAMSETKAMAWATVIFFFTGTVCTWFFRKELTDR